MARIRNQQVVGSSPIPGSIIKSGISEGYSLEMPLSLITENGGK